MRPVVPILDVTVAVSTAAAVLYRSRKPRDKQLSRFGPEPALAAVVALILLNQLLFAVHIQRAHHGDTSFISRSFLPGWFDVPRHNTTVTWLADHLPGPPGLLSPTVLRVQAFLELPLVLLTFAAVLAATRYVPVRATATGPYTTALTALLARALTLFLLPALAIRYGLTFAHPQPAAAAALLVLAAALRREDLRLLGPAAATLAVGYAVAVLTPGPYVEATILRSATGALLATTALCALLDTTRTRLVARP
ncbi:hypothetical protein [Kitasatospora sp. NPDC101183]|uniref:hypothetical protein n=1 Tax=Kitasatospora sp. NPDC101183 TaxID=3364100 RepID=UPI0037F2FC51